MFVFLRSSKAITFVKYALLAFTFILLVSLLVDRVGYTRRYNDLLSKHEKLLNQHDVLKKKYDDAIYLDDIFYKMDTLNARNLVNALKMCRICFFIIMIQFCVIYILYKRIDVLFIIKRLLLKLERFIITSIYLFYSIYTDSICPSIDLVLKYIKICFRKCCVYLARILEFIKLKLDGLTVKLLQIGVTPSN